MNAEPPAIMTPDAPPRFSPKLAAEGERLAASIRAVRIYETPDVQIVTGPGPAILELLTTPTMLRALVHDAKFALKRAWEAADLAAEEPDPWMVDALPEFWTQEARYARWIHACGRVLRCLAAVRKREAQLVEVERRWAA
jgi:hypothetical protein